MMMHKVLGLRTVSYYADNLEAAKIWYSKAFSLEPYFDEPFYVGFNVGGYELGLQPEDKDFPAVKGNASITYWGVEDILESYRHFLEIGATEHEGPVNVGGDLMVASVIDPWGNIIGIIYNPEFKI
jgi:predicted enzyme related to lactoylglutathione lyase